MSTKKPTPKRGRKARITKTKSQNDISLTSSSSKKDLKVYNAVSASPSSENKTDEIIILCLKVDVKNLKKRSSVPIPYSTMGYEFEHYNDNMIKSMSQNNAFYKNQLSQQQEQQSASLSDISNKIVEDMDTVENKVMNRVIESMMEYSEAKKQNKWPRHVNIACFWCSEFFDTIPVGVPKKVETKKVGVGKNSHLKKLYYCEDNYCTFECATADLFEKKRGNFRERYSLLCCLYKDAHNIPKLKKIKSALPKRALVRYGGPHSIKRFRELSRQDKVVYNIVEPPMIPVLAQMETNCMDFNTANRSNSYIPMNRQVGNIPPMSSSVQQIKNQSNIQSNMQSNIQANNNTLLKFMKQIPEQNKKPLNSNASASASASAVIEC